jgi:hypothetical protein
MHPQLDPRVLRAATIALALILLYGSRMMKGSARETPAGLAFGIKPLFAWARGVALPAYIIFFAYITYTQRQPIPWWMPLLFIAAIAIGILQMPGTIVLTPTSVTQKFWFLRSKAIPYKDVVALQTMQAGRITRVVSNNRTIITHSANHSASAEFQKEIQRRTNKHLT